jgi:hypothetical protein
MSMRRALGLDGAVAYTFLARIVNIVGSTGTVLLIVRFLSPVEQSVVVTLLDGAEEAHNQQHSPGATRDVHHPRQESVGNRTI